MRKLMTVAMLALTVGAFAQSGNKGNNQEGKYPVHNRKPV